MTENLRLLLCRREVRVVWRGLRTCRWRHRRRGTMKGEGTWGRSLESMFSVSAIEGKCDNVRD